VLHALSEPASTSPSTTPQEIDALRALPPITPADARTRDALWRNAGIVRSAEGLRRLLDDPHPLARLLARSALERTESRGAHQRLDHPERDPSLDHRHYVISGDSSGSFQAWA